MKYRFPTRNWKNLVIPVAALAMALFVNAPRTGGASLATEFFPLYSNSYWLYSGTVNVLQAGDTKAKIYNVDLKCEVKNVYHTRSYSCAEILGFPDDLWWYSGNLKRTLHAIIRSNSDCYYLLDGDLANSAIAQARLGASLDKYMVEDCKFIDAPLTKLKIYGKEPTADPTGPMFGWQVTAVDNLPAAQGGKKYTIIRRFNTDHTIYELVPFKGVVSAELSHHGTTCDISLKLRDFHKLSMKSIQLY